MSDRADRIIDALFVKRVCGWCGKRNLIGEGWQFGLTRWCSEEHAGLDFETAA